MMTLKSFFAIIPLWHFMSFFLQKKGVSEDIIESIFLFIEFSIIENYQKLGNDGIAEIYC